MAIFKKKYKPLDHNLKQIITAIEDDVRDLINWIELKNKEEVKVGEGKKIEDDTATELIDKLKGIAIKIGMVGL